MTDKSFKYKIYLELIEINFTVHTCKKKKSEIFILSLLIHIKKANNSQNTFDCLSKYSPTQSHPDEFNHSI